jgi:hypothetical protein
MTTSLSHVLRRPALLVLLLLGALFLTLGQSQQNQQTQSIHDPVLTNPPDKNAQMQMQVDKSKKASFEAANVERKRQIADDTSKLLELATELKAEVDKTSKDTLSLNVIRKAESIEKLAHGVKEKMKLSIGAS